MNTPQWLLVHHLGGTVNPLADTSNQTFEDVNAWHRDAKDPNGEPKYHYGQPSSLGHYLAYHYFIAKDGTVTQGRADNERGFHTIGYNEKSIGIVLAGNFDVTVPTWEQRLSLKSLLSGKMRDYGIPPEKIVPHRTFANKSCFGSKLSDSWARALVVDNFDNRTSLIRQLLINIQLFLNRGKMFGGLDKGCDEIAGDY